jgi:polyisoprenyl-teichoic acid--peptidoglycan teichoic acid transferase
LANQTRVQYKKRRKKKSKKRKFLRFLLLLFLVIGGYFTILTYSTFQAANDSFEELARGEKSKLRKEAVTVSKDPISILLMGVESYSSGGGERGRTDTLIVATINPKDQTMKLLSIPRDTRVTIAGKGKKSKINHAYVYGGKEATIETVEDFLEIPIDYYATVSFEGFKDIIDEIGGVTVDVPFDFWEKSDVTGKRIYFKEGKMKLDGEEALAYARMRKRDPRGDFGRNERQQQIITAVVDKLTSPTMLLKLDDVARHIGDNVQTNLRVSEALAIQKSYPDFNSSKIEKLTIKGHDEYIDGVYYFEPNEESLEKVKKTLKKHLKQDKTIVDTEDSDEENEE